MPRNAVIALRLGFAFAPLLVAGMAVAFWPDSNVIGWLAIVAIPLNFFAMEGLVELSRRLFPLPNGKRGQA